jgi:hypothetical protein
MIKRAPDNVRYLGQFGEHILTRSFTARDPKRKFCDLFRDRPKHSSDRRPSWLAASAQSPPNRPEESTTSQPFRSPQPQAAQVSWSSSTLAFCRTGVPRPSENQSYTHLDFRSRKRSVRLEARRFKAENRACSNSEPVQVRARDARGQSPGKRRPRKVADNPLGRPLDTGVTASRPRATQVKRSHLSDHLETSGAHQHSPGYALEQHAKLRRREVTTHPPAVVGQTDAEGDCPIRGHVYRDACVRVALPASLTEAPGLAPQPSSLVVANIAPPLPRRLARCSLVRRIARGRNGNELYDR